MYGALISTFNFTEDYINKMPYSKFLDYYEVYSMIVLIEKGFNEGDLLTSKELYIKNKKVFDKILSKISRYN